MCWHVSHFQNVKTKIRLKKGTVTLSSVAGASGERRNSLGERGEKKKK